VCLSIGLFLDLAQAQTSRQLAPGGDPDWDYWSNYPHVFKCTSGNVGIGITDPYAQLHLSKDNYCEVYIDSYHDSVVAVESTIKLRRGRGDSSYPNPVMDGDNIGVIQFYPYVDGAFRCAALIRGRMDGIPGSGSYPTSLVFETTADGSSDRLERLRIQHDGNIGIGTTNAANRLHVNGDIRVQDEDSDMSQIYFYTSAGEQLGRIGTNAASEDLHFLAGNGSTQQVVIKPNGNVGIGKLAPDCELDVDGEIQAARHVRVDGRLYLTGKGGWDAEIYGGHQTDPQFHGKLGLSGNVYFHGTEYLAGDVVIDETGNVFMMNGNVGIGTDTPNHPLEMGSGAYCSSGGAWTNASSRELKENIRGLTEEEAMAALCALSAMKFNYKIDKEEEHIGFIAEDVPDLVATKDRKSLGSMDIIAVLTKVVQMQQEKIEELEARLDAGR